MWLWSRREVKLLLTLLASPLILLAPVSQAADESATNWQWGGFLSQGWTITDENNYYGQSSDGGSFNFRELGLNATLQLNPQLRLSGQLLSRWAGKVDEGDPNVDYLFADWSFMQRLDQQAGIRLGRIKNPIGFYNDTRDVAFTRPSILLPQSIYLNLARELFLASDGLGLYYRHQGAKGTWMLDAILGRPNVGIATEFGFFRNDLPGDFNNGDLQLIRGLYEANDGGFRLAYTHLDINLDFDSTLVSLIDRDAGIDFQVDGLSAQFNFERYSLTAEYVQARTLRHGFIKVFPILDATIESFFLQAEYRVNELWTLLLRYDDIVIDKDDKDGTKFAKLVGGLAHTRFAEDWTLGVSYQATPDLLLRAELHYVNGAAWLPPQDNENFSQAKKRWNMLLLQASYRF